MKRIVVACDGTWDRRDQAGKGGLTNVAHMDRAIPRRLPDGTEQVLVYDDGIGSRSKGLRRAFEGATGLGIGRNIRQAYRAVCKRYEAGDELWFFGFSRGAYTVRSVTGMIRSCGILEKPTWWKVRRAYRQYRNRHHPDCGKSVAWRGKHSREEPRVRFIGVWDTVGALGIPYGRLRLLTRWYNDFHDVQLSSRVDHACHAVAIDERRHSFQPTLWATQPSAEGEQVVEQCWFPGVHRDVGGGHVDRDGARLTGLSDAAFAWMAERARRAGLVLDEAYVAEKLRPEHLDSVASDTLTGLWRRRPHVRYIGDPRVRPQEVGREARERHGHPPAEYRPDNLVQYLGQPDVEQPGVVAPPPGRPDCRVDRCKLRA